MKQMRMTLKKAIGAAAAFGSLFAAGATVAFAQVQNGATSVTLCDPLGNNCAYGGETFATVANNVINFLSINIAVPLAVIMVLVGAFQMMTSAGDPEKFTQGRKTLTYAAIGFAIAILAGGITSLIQSVITGS